jgi:hypothetical protein
MKNKKTILKLVLMVLTLVMLISCSSTGQTSSDTISFPLVATVQIPPPAQAEAPTHEQMQIHTTQLYSPESDFDFNIDIMRISNEIRITGYRGSGTDVNIPPTIRGFPVISIDYEAFYHHINLTSVTIPDSVISIDEGAFRDCSGLTSVTIGNSVTRIGEFAFYGCTNLTAINVDANNTSYASENGVLYNKSKTTLIAWPIGKTVVIIPNRVTSIGDYAFYGFTGLTSITIPNSVTSIGGFTFANCTSLASVTIPNSVTNIGEDAFSGCTGLASVTIPNSVTNIGKGAFSGCTGLTSITIPSSVTNIGEEAFGYCTSLTSVTFTATSKVAKIEGYAFQGCTGLTSVTIPNSVTSIGFRAFDGCSSLTRVTFQGTISSSNLNDGAFGRMYDNNFFSVTISNTYIGDLRAKYLAGGIGTYTRPSGGTTWTKQ